MAATSHRFEKCSGQYRCSVCEQRVPATHIISFAATQCPGPRERVGWSRFRSSKDRSRSARRSAMFHTP
eukprot:7843292-Pyramimonas_sp.AAC.1